MKNKSNFSEIFAPIITLVVICLVVAGALAGTYGVTKPIIDRNAERDANIARTELLPAAEGEFEEYNGKLAVLEKDKVFVDNCYKAKNGEGIVVTVKTKSYGGLLTAMIGIDKDGAITNIKVTEHGDTPGVGTKAQDPKHLNQYKGLNKLGDQNIKNDTTVQAVSGATVSSTGIHKAAWCALDQFKNMGGVK